MNKAHLGIAVVLLFLAAAVFAVGTSGFLAAQEERDPTVAPDLSPEEAVALAAERGDIEAMRELQGTQLRVEGRSSIVLRDTHAYQDIVLLTGRDFRLAGGRTGFEVVVRVPASLRVETTPPIMDVTGVVTDFEPRVRGERLIWSPVITVSFMR